MAHLLQPHNIECVLLTGGPNLFANLYPNPGFTAAYMRAYNYWLIDKWLSFHERFKGSVIVSPQNIEASVKEIERVGHDPRIVQILLLSASPILYG